MTTSNNTAARNFVPVTANILRESAKAFQVEVSYWTSANAPVKKAKMWAPKSCSEVKDGVVIGIADFVLAGWEKDHNEYCRQFSHKTASINWNLAERDDKKAAEKAKADDFKALRKNVIEFVTPYAEKELVADAACWVVYGEYIAKEFSIEAGAELAELGRSIQKKHGVNEKVQEWCLKEVTEKHDKYNYKNTLLALHYDTLNMSILGDFRATDEWLSNHNAGFNAVQYFSVVGCNSLEYSPIKVSLKKFIEARKAAENIYYKLPKA